MNGNARPIVWVRKPILMPRDYSVHIPDFRQDWWKRLKSIPQARWDRQLSCWLLPRNENSRMALKALYGKAIFIEH